MSPVSVADGVCKYRLGATVSVPAGDGSRVLARIVARTERTGVPPEYEVETLGHVRVRLGVAERLVEPR